MIKDYYPDTQSAQADWWQNILTEGPVSFTNIGGLDATFQGNVLRDAAWAGYVLRTIPQNYDQFVIQLTGYAQSYLRGPNGIAGPSVPALPAWPGSPLVSCPQGIEERRGHWVAIIKSQPGYNPLTHGVALRLEPTGTPFVPGDYVGLIRELKATGPATLQVKLDKARGEIEANCLYGRPTGTASFSLLGKYTAATATVTLPGLTPGQVQEWEFYTRGVIKDQEIGQPSPHATLLVKG